MMHPHTQLGFVNEEIGIGVFATQFIPKGTVLWVLDELDRKLDDSYINSLTEIQQERIYKYAFRDTVFMDSENKLILASDLGQFMNHSTQANCVPLPYELVIACKDIEPGEELTDDYRWFDVDYAFEYKSEDGTAKKVKANDIFDCYAELERLAEESLRHYDRVSQPLESLIKPKYLDKIKSFIAGQGKLNSILDCYRENSQKFSLK